MNGDDDIISTQKYNLCLLIQSLFLVGMVKYRIVILNYRYIT